MRSSRRVNQKISQRTSQKGLSLVEVLVALVLVSVAVSMFVYFTDALRITRMSKEETLALTYARQHLDALKSAWQQPKAYLEDLDLARPDNVPVGFRADVNLKDAGVGSIDLSGEDGSILRTVTITLVHESGKSYSLSTQIARPTGQRLKESP